MCGIVGVYRFNRAEADRFKVLQAASTMRHRGPDGEGYLLLASGSGEYQLCNGPDTPANILHPQLAESYALVPDVVLGHRRLAIIDLSPSGHEPMSAQNGTLWLTFNGEVYNYLELREELKALGYTFVTDCDAEVILQAYAAWGVNCLARFIGMFAFALWDQTRRRLWCVRDRLGIKPFYYAATPEQFSFASEVKALRVLEPLACQPDMAQLSWFLKYGLVYNAPNTFFEGVRELPGGYYLLVENGRVSEPVRWWDVDIERARETYNLSDPEGEFLRLMRESVRLRLRSDVPVGTCLSGGLDSSTIVALATEQLNGDRMNSFSALYPVKGLDERAYVDLVSSTFNTIRHDITPDPNDYLRRLEKITWHQDIPTATASVYSQNFVMKLAHGNVTVLLDGQGADELFAGYLSHVVYHLNDLRRRDPARWLREQAAFVAEVWPRFNASLNWRQFGSRVYQHLRYGRTPLRLLNDRYEELARLRREDTASARLDSTDATNNFLYQALVRDSIPSLLHYEDRNSMAYSIEARVPFLDHRLVEFALAVPSDLKVRGPETKGLMRRALRGVLPDAVVDRKDKLGYPTPFNQWLRGPLQNEVGAFLHDRVMKRDWYAPGQVEAIWKSHLAGQRNMESTIHRMITADMWYEQLTTIN